MNDDDQVNTCFRAAGDAVERARDSMMSHAEELDQRAIRLEPFASARYVVEKLRQAAKDTRMMARALPCFGLRHPED